MEIFSYHLIVAPVHHVMARLMSSRALRKVEGLRYSECLLTMKMGQAVTSPTRYNFGAFAFFAWWKNEANLDRFLTDPPYKTFQNPAWHVRLKFYRRWGMLSGLEDAHLYEEESSRAGPVVAVTLAKLRLTQTLRFAKWGRPVESQIRDHPGQSCAAVAFRPLNTFSTFSIWKSEEAMLNMVRGRRPIEDGTEHRNAMVERANNPFHHEFTTMRFVPLSEHGSWQGRTNLCAFDEWAGAHFE